MYILYYAPGAASMVVHQTLIECDVPHELRAVDLEAGEQRRSAYLALNPEGVVPTLIMNGHAHAEAAALTLLLAERHPDHGLAPASGDPERAAFVQWMLYMANTVQPAFRQWFYPADFGHDADDGKRSAQARIETAWARIDRHLANRGPHLLRERFSVADLFVLMLMRWSRNMPRPATDWASLAALATRLKARPSWGRLCDSEGLTEWR